ncbi:hypothetical protein LBMAG51_05160 [Phycisphaerae bacterium]|nr:hypothetical protein LBMAG51_05160 [Phycisphaerae bacterium]
MNKNEINHQSSNASGGRIETPYSRAIPQPTSGPIVTALGVAFLGASMVTDYWVLAVGIIVVIFGMVVWFKDIFPDECLEEIPAELLAKTGPNYAIAGEGEKVERPLFPAEVHPYRSGVVGGLVGGVAMAIVACMWGIVKHGSVWLPINLLTGAVVPDVGTADLATLEVIHPGWFAIAVGIHLAMSVAVGSLYTTALPMMPRRPIFAGGVLVPVIVTGLVWATLGVVNPALEKYISWPWFIGSQFAFGIACGWWVSRGEMVSTMTGKTLAQRLRIERGGKK